MSTLISVQRLWLYVHVVTAQTQLILPCGRLQTVGRQEGIRRKHTCLVVTLLPKHYSGTKEGF